VPERDKNRRKGVMPSGNMILFTPPCNPPLQTIAANFIYHA